MQPLQSPIQTPPPCSPRTPQAPADYGPPAYSELLFPLKEVDETVEDSEDTEQGEADETQPMNAPVVEVISDQPHQEESQYKCNTDQEVHHGGLTNGVMDADISDKIPPCDMIDQNENKKQPNGPVINCIPVQLPITVGGGISNENNCNNNDARRLPPPNSFKSHLSKRVTFEDGGSANPQRMSPGCSIRTGERGSNVISALYHSENTDQLCHHAIDSSRRHHQNRDDCCDKVSNNKQNNCILPDVRQMSSGMVNGSIIFPEAPPGTPV